MEFPLNIKEESINHADLVRSIAELLDAATRSRERMTLLIQLARGQAELDSQQALSLNDMTRQVLGAYPIVAQQHYNARKILRCLTLGLSARRDREVAAQRAREELVSLLEAVRGLQNEHAKQSMRRRVQLLLLSCAGQPAIMHAALRLLEGFAPEDAAYIKDAMQRAMGGSRERK